MASVEQSRLGFCEKFLLNFDFSSKQYMYI
nr:MAG TPA: hypothetical protein [Caudoviricetes sp.]